MQMRRHQSTVRHKSHSELLAVAFGQKCRLWARTDVPYIHEHNCIENYSQPDLFRRATVLFASRHDRIHSAFRAAEVFDALIVVTSAVTVAIRLAVQTVKQCLSTGVNAWRAKHKTGVAKRDAASHDRFTQQFPREREIETKHMQKQRYVNYLPHQRHRIGPHEPRKSLPKS
jgi:hypothetical protein